MKKYLAIILAVFLHFMISAAIAEPVKLVETSDTFDLSVVLPEGATLEQDIVNGEMSLIHILFAEESHPQYTFVVSYSELHGGKLMSDLTNEEIEALFATVAEEMEKPSYVVQTLDDGIKVMIVNEESASDYAYIITIYEGYFIQGYIVHDDYVTLTDEEVNEAISVMDSMLFLPPA